MNVFNKKLEQLYLSQTDNIFKMYKELNQLGMTNFSYPLLLHVWEEEYSKTPIKLMIIGQETNGWGAVLETPDDVISSMKMYEDFNLGRNYNSTFWQWVHKINYMLGNPDINCFVWNNILKFGKECDKGHPDWQVTEHEHKYFNVISDEIDILKPEVCIFLTGPSYDNNIRLKFPDVEFINFGGYKFINEVAKLKSKNLPFHSYRTYHPGYGVRYSNWYTEVFDIISNAVKKDLLRKD